MYNSPIRIITSDLGMKVTEDLNEQIYQSVLNVGIDVDKGELLRALQYDRQQYEKGYADGKADALKWISVKDRLPEIRERVLVYHDDGMIRFGINYGGFADVVSSIYLNHNHHTCFSKVTHWMPLPQPPKGE